MAVEYRALECELDDRLERSFGHRGMFIEVNPGRVVMPRKYEEIGNAIRELSVRRDDVWLMSYPRTGSTWAQELVWLLGNDLDYGAARSNVQAVRTPLLELSAIFSDNRHVENFVIGDRDNSNSVQFVDQMCGRRFVKSHLPWQLHPQQMDTVRPKIIYIVRNPKDLAVSYYFYCQLIHGSGGNFRDFCDLFLDDCAPIGPMWSHVLAFWKRRNQGNILFLKYEDMKRHLPRVIRECAKFLEFGRELTDGEVSQLCEHLQFEKMQRNPAVNLEPLMKDPSASDVKFIRKGEIGDWKNHMDEELSARFDRWIEERFGGTGLEFEYE